MNAADVFLVSLRLFFELLAYYNAKLMYSSTTSSVVSPLLITYITHSVVSFLVIQDVLTMKKGYFASIYKDTGVPPTYFLFFTFVLSFIFNLSHIPKYFSLNHFSDLFIVSFSCLSVIATHWLCVVTRRKRLTCTGVIVTVIAFIGVYLLVTDECKTYERWLLALLLFIGSVFSGFYTVFMKIFMEIRPKCRSMLGRDMLIKICGADMDSKECYDCAANVNVNDDDGNDINGRLNVNDDNGNVNANNGNISNHVNDNGNDNGNNNVNNSNDNVNNKRNDRMVGSSDAYTDHNANKTKINFHEQLDDVNKKETRSLTVLDELISDKQPFSDENGRGTTNYMQHFIQCIMQKISRKGVTAQQLSDLSFMRHYLGTTGILTLLCYWPMIIIPLDSINPTFGVHGVRLVIHVIISNILSVSQNILYFVLVTCRSPHFVQLSGMILQPTIICVEMLMVMTCFTKRLVGFGCIFGSLFFVR